MTKARPTIAVVDDDLRLTESLEDLFAAAGYETATFGSAQALLDFGLDQFDLIVADIGMPAMDGFELRETTLRQRPNMPIILVTGRHELAERGRTKGIAQVFRKPFDAPALLAAIGVALGSPVLEDDHDDT